MDHEDLYEQGLSFFNAFERSGEPKDIEEAVKYFCHALEVTPDGHPSLARRHAGLGVSYTDRYRRLGQVGDLDKSIEHNSRALELISDSHEPLPDWYAALGVSYGDRYRRLGQVSDLERSIEYKSQALTLTPDGNPYLSNRHAALGVSYEDRYRRLGQVSDLEKSIEYKSQALALTPDGNPLLSGRHANLGLSYTERYKLLGQVEDISKAIEYHSTALGLTPDGHLFLPDRHDALGVAYGERYWRLDQEDDLQKFSEHLTRALALTPKDHLDLPNRYNNQAHAFWFQYKRTGNSSHLEHALLSFRNASQVIVGTPGAKFRSAFRWANLASKHTSLCPIEAYQTTIDLLPQFIWLGATTHQRYQDLSTVEDLAISAAAAAILHSDYKLALEWLEHARCVVWNQTLMLRTPFEELRSAHPDLASRLQAVAQQLHDASSILSAPQTPSDSVDPEQIGRQRRHLAKEYEDLLAEARILPGFKDFLRPMKADTLVRAARHGPIAVINCHQDRCDALLILPGQADVQHIPLPDFTQDKAQIARFLLETSLRNGGVRERGFKVLQEKGHNESIGAVLLALWTDVVKPVLEYLGYMNDAPPHSLPHITWCPTGPLSFLPLHAAGDYDQPGSRVFDYVVSSYVPTLTAFTASTPSSSDRTPRVLAIGQEHTPGHSPLPGTAKELECVASHMEGKAEYSQLTGNQVTTTNALDTMEKHDWVHLACHAHQNVEDPTMSGFFLQDGTLDLAAINRRSFRNKGLAYLSACQTATGDEQLPDEAIHLASGMLMAGYPSVIATMWSVVDADAPFVADGVYAELMKDGMVGNGKAGRALHKAVGALRDKVGEKKFTRWVPYIHMGS